MKSAMFQRTRIIFGDGQYEAGVGLGQWAFSIERREPVIGDVRVVGGILMRVLSVEEEPAMFWVGRWKLSWVPVDEKLNNFERLEKWKRAL